MDPKLYFTVFVVSIFAACGYCEVFRGVPILFPTSVFKFINKNNVEEEKQPTPYVSYPESDSMNPTSLQSHSSEAGYPHSSYSNSIPSNTESLHPSVRNYDYSDSSINNINSDHKTFAQIQAPPCARASALDGLCEDDPDYDSEVEERFSKALQKANFSQSFYDSVLSKLMEKTSVSVNSRMGIDRILGDPVCPAKEKVIFPKRGMTRSNEWVFLLNQGNVKQAIKVEECLNSSRLSRLTSYGDLSCGITTDTGVESVCKQKFIFKNMISMDRSGSNVVTEAILIPSCCVCLRKLSSTRFGNRNGLEFDKSGNLITEQPPEDNNNIFDTTNKKPEILIDDDEDFNFGLPPM